MVRPDLVIIFRANIRKCSILKIESGRSVVLLSLVYTYLVLRFTVKGAFALDRDMLLFPMMYSVMFSFTSCMYSALIRAMVLSLDMLVSNAMFSFLLISWTPFLLSHVHSRSILPTLVQSPASTAFLVRGSVSSNLLLEGSGKNLT